MFEIIARCCGHGHLSGPSAFSLFPTAMDGLHVIEKGSPMVQVIPFRRDSTELRAEIRAETAQERVERERDAQHRCRGGMVSHRGPRKALNWVDGGVHSKA